jgi:uncharacterized protein (DUF1800 family)
MISPFADGRLVLAVSMLLALNSTGGIAGEANPAPPIVTVGKTTNGFPLFVFPFPATEQYTVYGSDSPGGPFVTPVPGSLMGPTFTVTNGGSHGFYRVSATPMSSNALLNATVLNRLTYGPTPADIEHIAAIGANAFIEEQLDADEIVEDLDTAPPIVNTPPDAPPTPSNWIRISDSGTASNTNLFIHMSTAGLVYIDDVRLVLGSVADTGENLLVNGDFEDLELTNAWRVGSIYSASVITNSPTTDGLAASGTNCLLLIGTAGGTGGGTSVQQVYSPTNYPSGTRFTISFSYLPVANFGTNVLTVRLSGSSTIGTATLPSRGAPPPEPPPAVSPIYDRLADGALPFNNFTAPPLFNTISDLRAYHVLRAVQSKRQLYEILVQFFENHLTTDYQKVEDWFDNNYSNAITNSALRKTLAVDLEWREHNLFRQALLNPNCTFRDLLKISIESPAMVIYLDTILSTRTAANENYARELLELHTFGADNGYEQQDIVEMAKIWTGWRVAKKDISVAPDPHARPVANLTNDLGVWVLNFATNSHNYTATKRLFTNVVVDPRFGAEFGAGQPYALTVTNNSYLGTNGMLEGYLVLDHLANLPYTAEFLSVKLCRTFVHENFDFGVYDYTAPDLSPEAQLVKDCMTAWNTPAGDGRKGNIRSVLRVIFGSALFRGHAASQQKIKTPLEFTVSAIRALRVIDTDTNNYVSTTADTDGYAIASPLSRMGGMNLFSKAEPDGYSEFGRIWLSTANLAERMRYAQSFLMTTSYGLKDDDYGAGGRNNISDPARLVRLKLPSTSWNDPGAIVDFFLGILYPGEGAANLGLDRQAAIDFLNSNDAGTPTPGTPFNLTTHDGRLRGTVALLMCLPRFQEQ